MRALGKVGLEDLWWIGVLLSICGALFGSLGDNLIKLSFTKEAISIENGSPASPIYCRHLWLLGMFCITILNTSMTLAAYSFADASLTIPFAGLHICFNVGFARCLNHETFTSRQLGFTFLILMGVSVVLTSGNHDTVVFTMEQIAELFGDVGFIVMTLLLLCLLALLITTSLLHHDARVRCLSASALVGTIAAFTQVSAKIVSEGLGQAINRGDVEGVFYEWVFYVALTILITAAGSQLYLLNMALKKYNAFVVVPIYNSFLIVLGSLYAAILFQEYKRFDTVAMVLMPIGVISTAVGVALLAWDHEPAAAHELGLGSPLHPPSEISMISRSQSFAGYSYPARTPIFEDSYSTPSRPHAATTGIARPVSSSFLNTHATSFSVGDFEKIPVTDEAAKTELDTQSAGGDSASAGAIKTNGANGTDNVSFLEVQQEESLLNNEDDRQRATKGIGKEESDSLTLQ